MLVGGSVKHKVRSIFFHYGMETGGISDIPDNGVNKERAPLVSEFFTNGVQTIFMTIEKNQGVRAEVNDLPT